MDRRRRNRKRFRNNRPAFSIERRKKDNVDLIREEQIREGIKRSREEAESEKLLNKID